MGKQNNKIGAFSLKPSVELKEQPHYLETNVRFSLRDCKAGGHYCILNLDRMELERLYKTMGKLENYTWKQFMDLPREKSFTKESEGSESYNLLLGIAPHLRKFCHFRVDGTASGVFRVFGAIEKDMIHVLLFDRVGKIHH